MTRRAPSLSMTTGDRWAKQHFPVPTVPAPCSLISPLCSCIHGAQLLYGISLWYIYTSGLVRGPEDYWILALVLRRGSKCKFFLADPECPVKENKILTFHLFNWLNLSVLFSLTGYLGCATSSFLYLWDFGCSTPLEIPLLKHSLCFFFVFFYNKLYPF